MTTTASWPARIDSITSRWPSRKLSKPKCSCREVIGSGRECMAYVSRRRNTGDQGIANKRGAVESGARTEECLVATGGSRVKREIAGNVGRTRERLGLISTQAQRGAGSKGTDDLAVWFSQRHDTAAVDQRESTARGFHDLRSPEERIARVW